MVDDRTRLCELLDDDPELVESVRLAASHDSGDADPWLVMLDGLDEVGALAYLDRKDGPGELADALAELPRIIRAGVDIDTVADIEGDLPAAIAGADEILASSDLRVLFLEEEPDAYPLVVVARADVAEILTIAARLGRDARAFT